MRIAMKRKYKPNKAKAGTKNKRRCPQCGKYFEPKDRRLNTSSCTHCGAQARRPQQTISSLKAEAWKLFSEIVRRSAADRDGNCRCITCSAVMRWQDIQAGHAIKSRSRGILFDRRIVRPQCPICNKTELRNDQFLLQMIEELGRETMDEVIRAKWNGGSWTKDELCQLIDQFAEEVKALRNLQTEGSK
jgi:ribosomal protein L37AE/L43A